jgi:KaiC/GvpD/RAD55 family RecA-like ATPase
MIFDELKRRDKLFNCIRFEGEEIRIVEGMRLDRDEFLTIFKLYLDAVGEKFPFKRCLLRELVKGEFKKDLSTTIAVGDVLDIVPTGIKELDMAMAGGLVKGSTTLLITEETKAKQKVLLSFIKKGLSERISIIYATSKRPFQQLVGELLMEVESLNNVVIVDFYEHLYTDHRCAELVEEDHRLIAPFSRIMFQRSIVKTIKSLAKDHAKIVIIDAYDDFARYYSPEEIFEILENQIGGLKRWNCTSLIVLDPLSYLFKRKGEDEVKKHFDNIMALSGGEKEASVVIEKLFHGTPLKSVIHMHW